MVIHMANVINVENVKDVKDVKDERKMDEIEKIVREEMDLYINGAIEAVIYDYYEDMIDELIKNENSVKNYIYEYVWDMIFEDITASLWELQYKIKNYDELIYDIEEIASKNYDEIFYKNVEMYKDEIETIQKMIDEIRSIDVDIFDEWYRCNNYYNVYHEEDCIYETEEKLEEYVEKEIEKLKTKYGKYYDIAKYTIDEYLFNKIKGYKCLFFRFLYECETY